ncbi:MAG: hypothetical protein K6G88_03585 [Lachnospiraceae bacterium]|nr:hypothetical protein [Lachnospiraceae bacterium]
MRVKRLLAVTLSALTLSLCFGSAASTTVKADDYVPNPWVEYFMRLEAEKAATTNTSSYATDHDAYNEDGDCIENPWAVDNTDDSKTDSEDGDCIQNPWAF